MTFTATVIVTSTNAVITTGTVNLINGGTCGAPTSTLASNLSLDASGQATFSTSSLGAGTHNVDACYSGNTGFAPSADGHSHEVQTIATTTTLSVTPSTQQYSDNVGLSATIVPNAATGIVQFQRSTDGGANYTNIGASVTVAGGSAAMTYQVAEAAGTAVRFKAIFAGTGSYAGSPSAAQALTVTKESATILYGSGNPPALQVSSAGGALNAGTLTLLFSTKETSPDAAAATAALGNVTNAALSVTLAPVGPGSSYLLTCTAGAVTGTGYDAARAFSCTNAAAIAANVYEVQASLAGNYYTGTYSDAVTVFDPSLGSANGGGTLVLDGDRVSIGFTAKYNKGGSSQQGNLIVVRHHADGTVSRLKVNALGSLVLGRDASVPMGWVTLTGKATYTTWNAAQSEYVTIGNQNFALYGEDRSTQGAGADRLWLGGPGVLTMPGTLFTAAANAQTLTGGNIALPGGKK